MGYHLVLLSDLFMDMLLFLFEPDSVIEFVREQQKFMTKKHQTALYQQL